MSEEELVQNIFVMHKQWVEDGVLLAKEAAQDWKRNHDL